MQELQWFPGHMTKAMRMMEENVKLCNGIIYVLDARAAFACINSEMKKIFADKPIIYALNKCDLIENEDLKRVLSDFREKNLIAVGVDGRLKQSAKLLENKLNESLEPIRQRNREKGVEKTMRVMVAGIPNTGKSTIINTLCGEKRAATGDKAGVTRGKQWVKLGNLELLDTPGTMPPKFANQEYAAHLAFIGSINDDILDVETLCIKFLEFMLENEPIKLNLKYGVETSETTSIQVYEEICKKRGFLIKGGEYDYERCARSVIDDLRKGRIGKIAFEK